MDICRIFSAKFYEHSLKFSKSNILLIIRIIFSIHSFAEEHVFPRPSPRASRSSTRSCSPRRRTSASRPDVDKSWRGSQLHRTLRSEDSAPSSAPRTCTQIVPGKPPRYDRTQTHEHRTKSVLRERAGARVGGRVPRPRLAPPRRRHRRGHGPLQSVFISNSFYDWESSQIKSSGTFKKKASVV